jgi:hypothetical protein
MYRTITAVVLLIVIVIASTAKAQDKFNGFYNLAACKLSPARSTGPAADYENAFRDVIAGVSLRVLWSHCISPAPFVLRTRLLEVKPFWSW